MPKPAPGESPLYTGTWDCAKKTIKREGFFGLYKGMNIWRGEDFRLKTFCYNMQLKTHIFWSQI
jgi:hypothetical protein